MLTGTSLQTQRCDGGDPPLRYPKCCDVGVDVVRLGRIEHRVEIVVDTIDHDLGSIDGVAVHLDGNVDDPSGIDDEVGRIEDAELDEPICVVVDTFSGSGV